MRKASFLFAAAAALALGSAGMVTTAAQATPKAAVQQPIRPQPNRRSVFGGVGGSSKPGRRARRGWNNRQVQRMAAKRRNQARHRALQRRRR